MINFNFEKKNIFITAASKGIGFELAKAFSLYGANVIISSSNLNNLRVAKKKILKLNKKAKVKILVYDQKKKINKKTVLDKLKKNSIYPIDILINNSGGPPVKSILKIKNSDLDNALNANLKSVIFTSQMFLPDMIKKKWGRIINLTSLTAKEPGANFALSNITRAGVVSFSKTLSQEVAKHGVTVNSILTGGVLTDRLKSLLTRLNNKNKKDFTKKLKKIAKLVPNGYIASPNEFIQLILFLATSNSSYVNGAAITVDGGTSKSIF